MSSRDVAAKLERLGFRLPEWCIPASEALVRDFETRFALTLPPDYRSFLLRHGGVVGTALCRFMEPTPCGTATYIDSFCGFTRGDRTDNIVCMTDLIEGAPDVIAIGENMIGAMFWLKCTGRDAGHVYMHDPEGRAAWPDARFHEMFENLSPEVARYLDARRAGTLPKKPDPYTHVYRVAESFDDLIARLEPTE